VDLKEALWTSSWCTHHHEDCSKWARKIEEDMGFGSFYNKYLVNQGKCLKLKILGLSLVAFGAQRMIIKFNLVHSIFF
jgi:hypothetical protein